MSIASRAPSARLFAERARRQRLRRLLTLVAVVAGAVVVGLLAWLVGWSDVLAVKKVTVAGVADNRTAEVLRVAEAPTGVPLLRVDTDAVADRVRALPEAEAVDVRRSWPNTLTIDVTQRTPVAAVSSGGSWWQVDDAGVLFGESAAAPESLPVLDAPGGDDEADEAVRAAGVAVLTSLPKPVLKLVDAVEAQSEADVRLTLTDGAVVRWGTAERIEDKARVLLALIAAQDETPSGYDVSAPEHPAVTP